MAPEAGDAIADVTARFYNTANAVPLACLLIKASDSTVLAANSRALHLFPAEIVGQALTDICVNPQQLNSTLKQFTNNGHPTPARWELLAAALVNHKSNLTLRVNGALYEATEDDKTLLISFDNQVDEKNSPFALLNAKLASIQRERHQLQRDNKNLELEVAKRTKKIELRNQELGLLNQSLNEFVAVVSHDLAGPTRRIQSFATLLERELTGDPKPKNVSEFLKFLIESSQRLTQMIQGSVRLSRTQPDINQWQRIDTKQVLSSVVTDLQALNPTVDFTANYGDLHQPYADAGLFEQLLQNLINNAIKFRRPDVPLSVDISSSENSELDYVEIRVSDNGSGISEDDLERVLRPFSRGSDVEGIPGTGLGMAMCARICQQHQGSFWIERSSTGENDQQAGTEIRFRLPASAPDPDS